MLRLPRKAMELPAALIPRLSIVGFFLSLALVVGVTWSIYRSDTQVVAQSKKMAQAVRLVGELRSIQVAIQITENEKLKYLLTGRESTFQGFESSLSNLNQRMAQLSLLKAAEAEMLDETQSLDDLDRLESLLSQRIELLQRAAEGIAQGDHSRAFATVRSQRAEELSSEIQALAEKLVGQEFARVDHLTREVANQGQKTILLDLVGGSASIFLLIATAVLIGMHLRERRKFELDLARARREAIANSHLKSLFLASTSHEIRTPLNGVVGLVDLLLGTELDSHQRDLAEGLQSSAQVLEALVSDILDLAKIESGKMELESVDFSIERLFMDVDRCFSALAQRKGLQLKLEKSSSLPAVLRGDPQRLRQVLFNLVSNAIKFTAQGSITLKVSVLERSEASRFKLLWEVIDTGIGISDAGKKKIFEPFVQADASTNRKFGGTGLGLTISKNLLQLMGGSLTVESKLQQGSRFWFVLDLLAGDEQALASTDSPGPQTHALPTSGRVLVVEDNPVNQKVAQLLLEKLGQRVELAHSGAAALEKMNGDHQGFDLIFMDCNMPEMDGYECTRRLRELPRGKVLPIIAFTAAALEGDRQRCLNAGMNDFITKPVRKEDLLRVLHKWMPERTLDPSVWERLSVGNPESDRVLKEKLVEVFLAHTPVQLDLMKKAVVQRDFESLVREVHSLKSSSATVGAARLAEAAKRFEIDLRKEQEVQTADWNARTLKVRQLHQECERVWLALREKKVA